MKKLEQEELRILKKCMEDARIAREHERIYKEHLCIKYGVNPCAYILDFIEGKIGSKEDAS